MYLISVWTTRPLSPCRTPFFFISYHTLLFLFLFPGQFAALELDEMCIISPCFGISIPLSSIVTYLEFHYDHFHVFVALFRFFFSAIDICWVEPPATQSMHLWGH